jgi:hypothetical protein
VGGITVAGREMLERLVSLLSKVMTPCESRRIIVVAPMPRYVSGRCCNEDSHMTNWESFKQSVDSKLLGVANTIKTRLFAEGWRRFRVVSPLNSFQGLSFDDVWDVDPVHPKKLAYSQLASSVLLALGRMDKGLAEAARGQKRPRSEYEGPQRGQRERQFE